MAMTLKPETDTLMEFNVKKESLKIPKIRHAGGISLSDIIAATIGEDARSGDSGYEDFQMDYGLGALISDDCGAFKDATSRNTDMNHEPDLYLENSNNAVDIHDKELCSTQGHTECEDEEHSNKPEESTNQSTNLHVVPEFATEQNSNTIEACFTENSSNSTTTNQQLDFGNLSFDIDVSIGFHTDYNMADFITNLCESKETDIPGSMNLQVVPEQDLESSKTSQIDADKKTDGNVSYDSDLEDSVHFVLPEAPTIQPEMPEMDDSLQPRKRRRSECIVSSTDKLHYVSNYSHLKSELASQQNYTENQTPKYHPRGIQRARSFSGNISHRAVSNNSLLNTNSRTSGFKTPTLNRTRSFSGAPKYDGCSPLDEERFNTSLNSLLGSPSESNSLSENPFFDDLKNTLFTDCTSNDCPTTLFEALSDGPKLDVYARERNLQSKFSSLQSKYPEEVRDLSSFYKCQSAEVETQRFCELHEDNLPLSFRNHLNRYYDDQLHMIMERVEKSLQLLTVAKRDIVTINRSFRPRPLLSRKAVSMMEEWYTRNYEHPYPSQTAVEALAKAGEINPDQVKKWFANKRNRSKNILPMTEVVNKKRKRQFSSRW